MLPNATEEFSYSSQSVQKPLTVYKDKHESSVFSPEIAPWWWAVAEVINTWTKLKGLYRMNQQVVL